MGCVHHWILDGYNVMHALDFLPSPLSFEVARERFLSWVSQFQTLGDKKVTVVFDDNVHLDGPREINRVCSVYSPAGFNGDGAILSIVRQTPRQFRPYLTIVTRDLMLRDAIFSYRCVVISPEAFKQEFETYRQHADRKNMDTKASSCEFYKPFRDFFENKPTKM